MDILQKQIVSIRVLFPQYYLIATMSDNREKPIILHFTDEVF